MPAKSSTRGPKPNFFIKLTFPDNGYVSCSNLFIEGYDSKEINDLEIGAQVVYKPKNWTGEVMLKAETLEKLNLLPSTRKRESFPSSKYIPDESVTEDEAIASESESEREEHDQQDATGSTESTNSVRGKNSKERTTKRRSSQHGVYKAKQYKSDDAKDTQQAMQGEYNNITIKANTGSLEQDIQDLATTQISSAAAPISITDEQNTADGFISEYEEVKLKVESLQKQLDESMGKIRKLEDELQMKTAALEATEDTAKNLVKATSFIQRAIADFAYIKRNTDEYVVFGEKGPSAMAENPEKTLQTSKVKDSTVDEHLMPYSSPKNDDITPPINAEVEIAEFQPGHELDDSKLLEDLEMMESAESSALDCSAADGKNENGRSQAENSVDGNDQHHASGSQSLSSASFAPARCSSPKPLSSRSATKIQKSPSVRKVHLKMATVKRLIAEFKENPRKTLKFSNCADSLRMTELVDISKGNHGIFLKKNQVSVIDFSQNTATKRVADLAKNVFRKEALAVCTAGEGSPRGSTGKEWAQLYIPAKDAIIEYVLLKSRALCMKDKKSENYGNWKKCSNAINKLINNHYRVKIKGDEESDDEEINLEIPPIDEIEA